MDVYHSKEERILQKEKLVKNVLLEHFLYQHLQNVKNAPLGQFRQKCHIHVFHAMLECLIIKLEIIIAQIEQLAAFQL